ncbi:MAG: hypothetical protein IJ379_06150 [Lachnospiraceae bacterium]|nr:hypothetical protein [Lachnospiraceae bacterium]
MNSVDALIREVQGHEALEIEEVLDEESLNRIEEKVLKVVRQDCHKSTPKRRRKKWLMFAFAAVLTMGLGLTAVAAKENEWDIELINFMGISDANTLQLESGEVEINQGQKSLCMDYGRVEAGEEKEVEMKAVSSIGDKNEVYIRIETDYVLPDDFDPNTDYILPEDYSLSVSPNKSGFGSVFTYFEYDNKLGFLMSISNCQDINKASISLHMEDLYLYHDLEDSETDKPRELLCAGAWDLNWSYHYKANAKTYHMLKRFQDNGVNYYLTKVEVSPISIRMEAFRMPEDRDEEYPDAWLEEVHFADGTVINITDISSAGMSNRMFAESYIGIEELGATIEPEKVEKLVIAGEEIKLQ